MLERLKRKLLRLNYNRFAKNAVKPRGFGHHMDQSELKREGFRSQCGQDKWLVEGLFAGKRNGVFVDVGAHDGESFSNTYFFEKQLGWNGLCVEPIPELYEKLRSNRSSKTVNAAISAFDETAQFMRIEGNGEMLSGLVDQYDPRHLERIDGEVESSGAKKTFIDVNCYSINSLLEKYQLFKIDYLSIDVEGAELSIIQTLDFKRFCVHVIGVENNYRDYRIPRILKQKGFRFHAIVGDEFYINSNALR